MRHCFATEFFYNEFVIFRRTCVPEHWRRKISVIHDGVDLQHDDVTDPERAIPE